ncbi:MAG TPA: hypothetical protein VG406_03685 [Isosphaeraceae bacterium]|jgi:hypothetical protein|nr:hypothetical protein [Isosphaeraceae bacterium]
MPPDPDPDPDHVEPRTDHGAAGAGSAAEPFRFPDAGGAGEFIRGFDDLFDALEFARGLAPGHYEAIGRDRSLRFQVDALGQAEADVDAPHA